MKAPFFHALNLIAAAQCLQVSAAEEWIPDVDALYEKHGNQTNVYRTRGTLHFPIIYSSKTNNLLIVRPLPHESFHRDDVALSFFRGTNHFLSYTAADLLPPEIPADSTVGSSISQVWGESTDLSGRTNLFYIETRAAELIGFSLLDGSIVERRPKYEYLKFTPWVRLLRSQSASPHSLQVFVGIIGHIEEKEQIIYLTEVNEVISCKALRHKIIKDPSLFAGKSFREKEVWAFVFNASSSKRVLVETRRIQIENPRP
jgi:hypothetical protein